ncbi:monovalent cation/H+ antiporter complex subunit F [Streptomyces rimosus]|uniref:monovalent cation/H+ antiporter complex subunit F n=1 Tax=Streptomyces rimosus TaxID=1927 RepID=UPI0006B2741B|nr:MrpF/PhaF family protein [Streptomyces rimosus]
MNGWLPAAALLLVIGFASTVWGAASGPVRRRVMAQNLATLTCCLVLLLLAQGYARPSYVDLALVLAVLGPAGTLVYARLLADELAERPARDPVARALGRAMTPFAAISVPLVVLPLCVATGPGRAMVKLLAIGALLIGGNIVSTRALSARRATGQEGGAAGG